MVALPVADAVGVPAAPPLRVAAAVVSVSALLLQTTLSKVRHPPVAALVSERCCLHPGPPAEFPVALPSGSERCCLHPGPQAEFQDALPSFCHYCFCSYCPEAAVADHLSSLVCFLAAEGLLGCASLN